MATNSIGSIKTAATNASNADSARRTGGIKVSTQQTGGAKTTTTPQQASATQQAGGAKIPSQQPQRVPTANDAPRPLTNLNGQRTGTLINTSA